VLFDNIIQFDARKDKKRCCVWFYGPSNSGKSKFLDLMSELLIAEPYSKSYSGFIEGQKVLAFKPQLLTMNEASIGSLMSKHEIANTKLMFEGRPFPVN
jgi:energy-coupling factor transporter ATP-binding protein EcfA2